MLSKIQSLVKAPKGQVNKFGNYKYRSCEDIVEAVKLVINPLGYYLTITDEIVTIANRVYVKATATLSNGEQSYSASAFAREEEVKKGMDAAQITGSASSYARKYALNGLFAIDDTKDADATNTHEVPTQSEKNLLVGMVYDTDMVGKEIELAIEKINECSDYKSYQAIQHRLEARKRPIDQIVNPTQKDITNHLKKSIK